jgi:ADP-ribosylglycohydrolase
MKPQLNALTRIKGGLSGVLIGDALGVPVEFDSRSKLKHKPVRTMTDGGIWDQPRGTWSDDSSMTLCLVNSLLEVGYNPEDVGKRFVKWWREGYCSAHGEAFDIGITTREALTRVLNGVPSLQAGSKDESSNGNGSLMRILPAALYFSKVPQDHMLKAVTEISSITHAHPRSQLACCLYAIMVKKLLAGKEPRLAYQELCCEGADIFSQSHLQPELKTFDRVLKGYLLDITEADIRSKGYVVYCLESAIWCLLNNSGFSSTVLAAVNLGDDTDTNGAVTGGLAGVYYGQEAIPQEWLQNLARWDEIEPFFNKFAQEIHGGI